MTTNVEIIEGALGLIGVIAETQPASSEQGARGLSVLNAMLEAWTEDGIDLGYFEQSSTTADCPIPKWAERGVTSKLALALRAYYPSAIPSEDLANDEKNGYATILRKSVIEGMRPQNMSSMPAGEGHSFRTNRILTDG